jgi:RNA polymerase sigma-70 factor (ECF subfamily)
MALRINCGQIQLSNSCAAVFMDPTKPSMVRPSGEGRPTLNRPPLRYGDMSDVQLVSASKQKDRIAFNWLVKRHERTVFGILYKMAPDLIDPSDLVQEVFLRLWMNIGTLQNPHSFRNWLKRVVTNLYYDTLRKRPSQAILSLDGSVDDGDGEEGPAIQIADPAAQPDELSERRETSVAIQNAIRNLPQSARMAMELRENEGLSYIEISALTGTPMGTVKSRIARARFKLQKELLQYGNAL